MTIKITDQQIGLFEEITLKNYINELTMYCYRSYPHLTKTIQEEPLKKALIDIIQSAEKIGFTQRGSVKLYLDMSIVFGIGFVDDPQYPWIKKLLDENKKLPQIQQADLLYDQALVYSENISGTKNSYMFLVADKLEKLSIDNIKLDDHNFSESMFSFLENLYPQKFQETGEIGMQQLIASGEKKALEQYHFSQSSHKALIVSLMFFLGHLFDADPFYEWANINSTFKNNTVENLPSDLIAKRLETRSKIWLNASVEANHYSI